MTDPTQGHNVMVMGSKQESDTDPLTLRHPDTFIPPCCTAQHTRLEYTTQCPALHYTLHRIVLYPDPSWAPCPQSAPALRGQELHRGATTSWRRTPRPPAERSDRRFPWPPGPRMGRTSWSLTERHRGATISWRRAPWPPVERSGRRPPWPPGVSKGVLDTKLGMTLRIPDSSGPGCA